MKKTLAILCVSLCVMFSCKPEEDDSAITPQANKINGHEYVDLGLPSGLKWATCNVGASKPEEYGNYYAWGETSPKAEYTEENSITIGEEMNDISGNPQYDAARANWGGSWRMPRINEMEELLDYCEWKWTQKNGVNGYKVIGRNGKSIFLPAAGTRIGSSPYGAGSYGRYWCSAPYGIDWFYGACDFKFGSDYQDMCNGYYIRENGQSVRPVAE